MARIVGPTNRRIYSFILFYILNKNLNLKPLPFMSSVKLKFSFFFKFLATHYSCQYGSLLIQYKENN